MSTRSQSLVPDDGTTGTKARLYGERLEEKGEKAPQSINVQVFAVPGARLERLGAILHSISEAIFSVDLNDSIDTWNRGAEKIFGFTASEIIGAPLSLIFRDDDLAKLTPTTADQTVSGRHKEGRELRLSISVFPIVTSERQPGGNAFLARESTPRPITENQPEATPTPAEYTGPLSAALIAGQIGTFRWNIKSNCLDWDDSLAHLFGREVTRNVRGLEDFIQAVHPEDREAVAAACARCVDEGCDFQMEFRVILPDGSTRWIYDRGTTMRDEAGRPSYMVGACVDVTERRRYEGQLKSQRDILHAIVAGAPLPELLESLTQTIERNVERPLIATILLVSPDGKYLMPAAGRSAPEQWTKLIEKLEIGPSVGSCGSAAYARERVIVSDIQTDPRWALLKSEAASFGLAACWSTPILSSKGEALGTFAVYYRIPGAPTVWELHLVDVLTRTASIAIERKHAEEKLRAAHLSLKAHARELQELSDAIPALVAFVDPNFRFQFCNRVFSEWMGRPCAEILERHVSEMVPPEAWPDIEQRLKRALAGETIQFEYSSGQANDRRCSEVIYTPRHDEAGRILGVILFANDITARKETEAALRASEERFRTMADNIAQFAWIADAQGSIYWYNQRWFEYTGSTLDEMKGWGWTKVHHPEHVTRVVRRIQQSWDTGAPWEDTFPLRGKDGQYRWFLSRALPIRDAEGKILCWFGTNTDVTEQRETALELMRTKSELERLNAALEQEAEKRTLRLTEAMGELESFSYSIVHDMRAPIRALLGFAQILTDDFGPALGPKGKESLQKLCGSALRMDGLIRDVLNYSNILRGELPLAPVNLEDLLAEVLASYPLFSPERIDVIVQRPLPPVLANHAALAQCVSNILGNAVKFRSPDAKPRVRLWAEATRESVRLNFEDNGMGIPVEERHKIFQLFYQLDKSRGGTGVGLAVLRKTISRMGGRVGVESGSDGGSRFWLEIKPAELP